MGEVAGRWGIPVLAGPFILAGAAYAGAALVLAMLLRPDPLLLARAPEADRATEPGTQQHAHWSRGRPRFPESAQALRSTRPRQGTAGPRPRR